MRVNKAIEAVGYGLSGNIGGLPKTTYYTPDGRKIICVPRMVTAVSKQGKAVERDANLDKGWLLSPPKKKAPHCNYCGEWHKDQKGILACKEHMEKVLSKTKKEVNKQVEEAEKVRLEALKSRPDLEQKIAKLEAMIAKLMER